MLRLEGEVENAGHDANGEENEDDEEEGGEEAPTADRPADGAVRAVLVDAEKVRHQRVRSFAGLQKICKVLAFIHLILKTAKTYITAGDTALKKLMSVEDDHRRLALVRRG